MSLWSRVRQQPLRLIRKIFVRTQVIDHNLDSQNTGQIIYVIESGRPLHRLLVESLSDSLHPQGPVISLKRGQTPLVKELSSLLSAQHKNPLLNYQLIPVGIYHGRMPRREKNWLRALFGESWISHSTFNFALRVLLNGRKTLIRISPPLSLERIAGIEQPTEQLAEKTATILHSHFHASRTAMLGPDLSHRRTLLEQILKSDSLQQAIRIESSTQGVSRQQLEHQCRKHLDRLAADFNPTTSMLLHRLLKLIWRRLYHNIRVINAESLPQANQGHQLVYLPCHRSHLDYLLLSYMLFEHGLMLPHIAAGDNLNIPLIGPLLRRGGAIFMRRSFQGDKLYPECFKAYLKAMTQKGHSLEYFIEGGRSRTGRLLPPKTGLLNMTVENFLLHSDQQISLVPVWISYDRLMETNSYQQELSGAPKKKESIRDLLSSLDILKEKYGEASLSFGAPITLDRSRLLTPGSAQHASQGAVNDLAHRVMQAINSACIVNSPALLATVLLSKPTDIHSRQGINQQLESALKLLKTIPNAPAALPEQDLEKWLDHAVTIGILDQPEGELFSISERQFGELAMYRNNIQHLWIIPGLLLLMIQRLKSPVTLSLTKIMAVLYPYLKSELFLPWPEEQASKVIKKSLTCLQQAGLIVKQGTRWQLCQNSFSLTLIRTVEPTLLRYYICLVLLQRYNTMPKGELIALSAELAGQSHHLFGFNSREYADPKVLRTFIELQCQRGLIEEQEDSISFRQSSNTESLFRHAEKLLQPKLVEFIRRKIRA